MTARLGFYDGASGCGRFAKERRQLFVPELGAIEREGGGNAECLGIVAETIPKRRFGGVVLCFRGGLLLLSFFENLFLLLSHARTF
jgi:hypothetical protein